MSVFQTRLSGSVVSAYRRPESAPVVPGTHRSLALSVAGITTSREMNCSQRVLPASGPEYDIDTASVRSPLSSASSGSTLPSTPVRTVTSPPPAFCLPSSLPAPVTLKSSLCGATAAAGRRRKTMWRCVRMRSASGRSLSLPDAASSRSSSFAASGFSSACTSPSGTSLSAFAAAGHDLPLTASRNVSGGAFLTSSRARMSVTARLPTLCWRFSSTSPAVRGIDPPRGRSPTRVRGIRIRSCMPPRASHVLEVGGERGTASG